MSDTQISRGQVAHLANLARIAMDDAELDALAGDLSKIVGSVARVTEVVTEDVPATSHPIPLQNVMREDVPVETLTQDQALRGAPASENGKFLVPQILGDEQ